MKTVTLTVVAGLVLLGIVWSPTIFSGVLNHSFPVTPSVSSPAIVDGSVPADVKAKYGAFFRDLAVVVKEDQDIKTTGQLLVGAQKAIKLLKNTDNLPDVPTLNKQVNDKLTSSVGLADKALDTDTRNKFANACDELASSLGVK